MAQIAEELFLLLVDNAAGRPSLAGPRRGHALGAATLLDLAYDCRIRPAAAGDGVPAGRLIALDAPGSPDPLTAPGWQLLRTAPQPPATVIKKLSRHTEDRLVDHLQRCGQIGRSSLPRKGFRRSVRYPLIDRRGVEAARAAMLAALFDRSPPAAPTAAVITVLHAVDGLGALLSLNDRGWRWVHARAGEIAGGGWVDESASGLREVNLAVTASAVRQALARLS